MAIVDVQFSFPDLAANVAGATEEINRFIAAQIQTNRGLMFDAEGAANGHPRWAPLRMRSGQILSQRGALRQSIAPRNAQGTPGPGGTVDFNGDDVVIGTNLIYAAMMNDGTSKLPGGVLRPRYAKALKIPLPPGTRKRAETTIVAEKQKLLGEADPQKRASADAAIAAAEQRLREAKTNSSRAKREKQLESLRQRIVYARSVQNHKLAERLGHRHRRVTGTRGDFIFRKWVRIPARPFDQWNAQDQAELDAALAAKIMEVAGR